MAKKRKNCWRPYTSPKDVPKRKRKSIARFGLLADNFKGMRIVRIIPKSEPKLLQLHLSFLKSKAGEVMGKTYTYKTEEPFRETNAKPAFLVIEEEAYSIKNWRDLMVVTCDILNKKDCNLLQDLAFRVGDKFLATSSKGMRSPKQIEGTGLYIELNNSAYSHVLHSQLLFRKFGYNLNMIGLVYLEKGDGSIVKNRTLSNRVHSNSVMRELTDEELSIFHDFIEDIKINYSRGFDFKETSIRLVESRIGRTVKDVILDSIRSKMFERTDGMWLLSDMVTSKENLEMLINRVQDLLDCEGAFAMDSLFGEFGDCLENILSGRDFKRFFDKYIAEKVAGKVRGNEGWRVCFRADKSEEEGWLEIANRVRDVLVASGDAISIHDVLSQLPHLDREVVLRICQENIKDAILFSLDEIEYLKLLEMYYLPDDFADVVTNFVTQTELNHGVASIVLFESEFDLRFGSGFRVNYGLEDDSVFKQVVTASFQKDRCYEWKKDTFVCCQQKVVSNVAEAFLQTHDGIFHEEEFFEYALRMRGMKNRGMLILTFLRKHCVRLSKEWWISRKGFEDNFSISEDEYLQIGNALNSAMGNKAFMPIVKLPDELYEVFPKLEMDGKIFQWNPYLLTSLCVWKVKNACVVNDEPSPYTVTAQIVPCDVGVVTDVVEYVLKNYPGGYFTSVSSAFEFLKTNNIRMTKTEKLVAKIREIIGVV